MGADYAAAGWNVVPLDGEVPPDRIVVRGCSVTARAQRDSEKALAALKRKFPEAEVVAAGCMAGSGNPAPPGGEHAIPTQTARAYLKVQDGCSGKCAFCIVPHFRGTPTSVPFRSVLERARAFLDAGYRELVVTGCNLALYRDGGHGLPDLVAALASMSFPERYRVRIGSMEPGLCDEALLDAIESSKGVCRFLHLSLQSASNAVLAAMRRPYRIEHVASFCADAARRLGPRLALGADVIAGFPGETTADFKATLEFISADHGNGVRFTTVHAFPYSERPGTEAAAMPESVPPSTRRARAKALREAGRLNREAFGHSLAGREVEVCVEEVLPDGTAEGWTEEHVRARAPHGRRRELVSTLLQEWR